MELRSDPRYLAGARELMAAVARRMGFPESACSQIALAVDEALCNVIRHGYDSATDRPIWLRLWPEAGNGLRIMIEDEAKQVDPEKIQSRDLEDIRPGGLGVHIMHEVMDSVEFVRREGGVGMRLTMVKTPAARVGDDRDE
ncbi:MAG: ATP-binding protein [Planctomycetota bacterium]